MIYQIKNQKNKSLKLFIHHSNNGVFCLCTRLVLYGNLYQKIILKKHKNEL